MSGLVEPAGERAVVGEGAAEKPTVEVLAFEVAGRRFGLWAADVLELFPAVAILALPGVPAAIEGLINVRGNVVPVFDLRARFGLPAKPLEHTDHLIMASGPRRAVALRVDRATELLTLRASDVEDAERVLVGARYVAGVARLPEGLLVIHDLRSFLSDSESAMLEEALRRVEAPEE